jgi:Tol biopolymer transport system component
MPDSWSPDGKTLLFESIKGGNHSLWALSLGDGKAAPFGNIQNPQPIDAAFSPDGRWVAYTSQETSSDEVFMQPFPATGAKFQIPHTIDDHAPVWSRNGKELFYATGPRRFAVAGITTQPDVAVANGVDVFHGANNNAPWFSRNFDILPDGKHLLDVVNQDQKQTDGPSAQQIQVVLNWFAELKQRVPPGK